MPAPNPPLTQLSPHLTAWSSTHWGSGGETSKTAYVKKPEDISVINYCVDRQNDRQADRTIDRMVDRRNNRMMDRMIHRKKRTIEYIDR